jgi:hypothetical protein
VNAHFNVISLNHHFFGYSSTIIPNLTLLAKS